MRRRSFRRGRSSFRRRGGRRVGRVRVLRSSRSPGRQRIGYRW